MVLLIERPTPDQPQLVLVFFIGGCTYAEIAALRFLASREEGTCSFHDLFSLSLFLHVAVTDYIIGTTNISTGNGIMNSILWNTPNIN